MESGNTALQTRNGADKSLEIKDSVRSMSRQIDQRELAVEAECDAKVKQLYQEADARVQKLEDELNEKIAENGQAQYTNTLGWNPGAIRKVIRGGNIPGIKTYDPDPANEALRRDYQAQIDQIKSETSRKVDQVKISFKEKAMAIEESALTLDKSYISNKKAGDISLEPSGTNMYIRNYKVNPNPSGAPVPLMAAPPKSLPGVKSRQPASP